MASSETDVVVTKGSMHSGLDKEDRFDSWEGNAVDLRGVIKLIGKVIHIIPPIK